MDTVRFETLLRFLSKTPSRRGALRLLAGSSLGGLLTFGATHASLAKKKKKVTLCHKGQTTIKVSKKAKKKHLKHGDTVGACLFRFEANPMTGANEVPPGAGDNLGSGSAQFTIQGNTICGTFQFSSTSPNHNVTSKHIHPGAAGAEGPPVVDFSASALNQQSCVTCPSAACANPSTPSSIIANPAEFYANTHTADFPNGAVRAQLQAVP